jgi:DNA-damage-inducible protein D
MPESEEKEMQPYGRSVFNDIRCTDADGTEFWTARLLGKLLGYAEYRNFQPVIEKAKEACRNSGHDPADHFEDILEMVPIGSGARRQMESVALSRYACYLIVQNADPAKPIVAEGQTYFAIQTRRQELADQGQDFDKLAEAEKRLLLREELRRHNRQLVDAAKGAGVETTIDYAIFQNHGYRGLYGGLDAQGIHRKKGLKRSQKILDHMGSTELAANLFRATQTEDRLRKDGIKGKQRANQTHFEVGQKVRKAIADIGGTMPEELPPAESIKKLEQGKRKELGAGEAGS